MGSPTESKMGMKLCLSKPVSILILAIAIITIPSSYAMWHHDGRMVPSCSRGSYHRLYPSSSVSSHRRAQLVDPINLMAEIFSVPVTFNSLMRQQHRHFSEMQRSEPRYEISNDETQFQILLDLPGVQAEDVSLELKDGGSLQISASRNTRQQGRMSSYNFAQTFTLDESVVDVENISATLSQGVLTISAPKLDKSARQDEVTKIPVMKKEDTEDKIGVLSPSPSSPQVHDRKEEEAPSKVDADVDTTETNHDDGLEITEEDI